MKHISKWVGGFILGIFVSTVFFVLIQEEREKIYLEKDLKKNLIYVELLDKPTYRLDKNELLKNAEFTLNELFSALNNSFLNCSKRTISTLHFARKHFDFEINYYCKQF